jgi:hypothetical protein
MIEYIERDAVMQKFTDHVKRSNNSDFAEAPTWNQAVQIVEDAPAVDAVPVVRCKDCRYRPYPNPNRTPSGHAIGPYVLSVWGICPYACGDDYYNEIPDDNSYCDRGERR